MRRHREKECGQRWRGGGIVQLDGATGGGGKGGGFGGGERAAVQSLKEMRAQRKVVYNTSYMETVPYLLFSVIRVT